MDLFEHNGGDKKKSYTDFSSSRTVGKAMKNNPKE